jgi:Na+-translocating ferredoxin:NAD+ oxidoreductase RnfG subunit
VLIASQETPGLGNNITSCIGDGSCQSTAMKHPGLVKISRYGKKIGTVDQQPKSVVVW